MSRGLMLRRSTANLITQAKANLATLDHLH
jgi:hypothetical protein